MTTSGGARTMGDYIGEGVGRGPWVTTSGRGGARTMGDYIAEGGQGPWVTTSGTMGGGQ